MGLALTYVTDPTYPMGGHMLSLRRLRKELSATWILVVFGIAFAVSQFSMAVIIRQIGEASFLRLQCLGLHARDYLDTFARWQTEGVMEFYRAHLILDDGLV